VENVGGQQWLFTFSALSLFPWFPNLGQKENTSKEVYGTSQQARNNITNATNETRV